jgi:hypothetical protein
MNSPAGTTHIEKNIGDLMSAGVKVKQFVGPLVSELPAFSETFDCGIC